MLDTPHCYLAIQPNQTVPRADYVVTVKTVPVATILGERTMEKIRKLEGDKLYGAIRTLITPPSHPDVGRPAGRYWYLPHFLEIPHLYCDFLQVESIKHSQLEQDYEELAVLSPPFAESLQACYGSFHGAVGIPNLIPASVSGTFR
jgi:hypothetical protein